MSRRYQEQIEVRMGQPQTYGVAMAPGWCPGVDLAAEEVPATFLWKGRVHLVRAVLARWSQRVPWWSGAEEAGTGALEHQVWRVEASAGRAFGTGVYDLVCQTPQGWCLEYVSD